MYTLKKNIFTGEINMVYKRDGHWLFSIPFDPANTDYANFKRDVEDGAELQDADGVVMSADAAKEFVAKLP